MVFKMKLYLIYARFPKTEIDAHYPYIDVLDYKEIDGFYVGLYAYTTNKEFAKEFMESRKASNFFFLKKINDDREEIERFTTDFKNSEKELVLRRFKSSVNKDTYISLVCTVDEYRQAVYDDDGRLDETLILILGDSIQPESDYYPLKHEYITALDTLWYTLVYDMIFGGHPNFDGDWNDVRSDTANEGLEYGLSPFGYAEFHKGRLTEELSEYTRFIILYRRLFLKGDVRNEEI